MSCKLSDKCDNVFACNVLRPNVELLGCNFYKPKKPMTNEEWFSTLSTKEKAEWLDKVAENCCQICDEENRELCRGNIAIGCKFENAELWEMWLKQPRREE